MKLKPIPTGLSLIELMPNGQIFLIHINSDAQFTCLILFGPKIVSPQNTFFPYLMLSRFVDSHNAGNI